MKPITDNSHDEHGNVLLILSGFALYKIPIDLPIIRVHKLCKWPMCQYQLQR